LEGWGGCAPYDSDGLSLGCSILDGRFFGAIVDLVEAFKEDFLRFLERGLECKNLYLNESTNLL